MDSKILMKEVVENKDRRFGSNTEYYPCRIEMVDGTTKNALFTQSMIDNAISRAERNPEDIPQDMSFWASLFLKKIENR